MSQIPGVHQTRVWVSKYIEYNSIDYLNNKKPVWFNWGWFRWPHYFKLTKSRNCKTVNTIVLNKQCERWRTEFSDCLWG